MNARTPFQFTEPTQLRNFLMQFSNLDVVCFDDQVVTVVVIERELSDGSTVTDLEFNVAEG